MKIDLVLDKDEVMYSGQWVCIVDLNPALQRIEANCATRR